MILSIFLADAIPNLCVWVWKLQVGGGEISDEERKARMDSVNPKYILRNYLCQSAIDAAEQGDFSEVNNLIRLMKRPYEDQPGIDRKSVV